MVKRAKPSNTMHILAGVELPDHKTAAPLDDLDRALLEIQQEDAFFSYRDFARTHGITEATVRNRLKRLKSAGVMDLILVINPYKIGYGVFTVVGISILADATPEQVTLALDRIPGIVSIMTVTGRYDLIVEYVCPDLEHYRVFVSEQLRSIAGISSLESFVGLDLHSKKFELGIIS